jgi:hypothetical protein
MINDRVIDFTDSTAAQDDTRVSFQAGQAQRALCLWNAP